MFSSPVVETLTISDLEQCLEEEDAAFERIRVILSNLIDQAQTAVSQDQKLSGRALMELEHNAEINKYFFTNNFEGKKTTSTTKRRPRSLILPDRASIKATTASLSNNDMRRVSVGSIHNNLPSSPIPNKNYNSSTSNRRLSSVSSTTNATTKDTILHPHHTRPTSRLQHQQDSSQLKKWVN
ncbi:hypothetical protein BDF20DRAFT_89892 [Mycotypha africana]|uniref:uncharacterized protein n=1 Tax=Mycotypha africana TaxID=64632 RepID=UPI002300CB34|nr:uncharacterized protein BDF20DRAFT_89892 [Mycotypha africana]KAI8992138.1 hypothetical protein BDF20DRAFT_89892 [Mycotypha africana]